MVYVALFRNLNLGHTGSPSREQLVEAFAEADMVRSFQTNGTVLFMAAEPRLVVDRACEALEQVGYEDSVVMRTLDQVRLVVDQTDEADPGDGVYRTTLSFFEAEELPVIDLPHRSDNGLVEIRRLDRQSAACVCWRRDNTIGDVNALLERLLARPVTTRTLGTMQRLLTTAASLEGSVEK